MLFHREDAVFRERYHQEKLAAQWAKAELNVTYAFTDEERQSAFEKLTEASVKFDPAHAGPMGLTAFQASVLSPAVFREMLKRCFQMKLTNGELAALIAAFDKDGTKKIHCADFMVTFTSLGFERRSAIRTAQLEKQRKMSEEMKNEFEIKQRQADAKMEVALDLTFTDVDFNSVLNKIRVLASNYDRSHPSAPSLQGFVGTDMKPNEFKHMMMRTFGCALTAKELAALVAFFPSKTNVEASALVPENAIASNPPSSPNAGKSSSKSPSPTRRAVEGVPRINNRAFLSYFNKIQREEQNKRHKERIARDRDFIEMQRQQAAEEERKKLLELQEQLTFTDQDEESCLIKLKEATKEYATDSAPFQEPLQGFKGPALPPDKFRDLMYRIFQVKFTMPEMGFMLSLLDQSGLGVFDGRRFITWFYKLARIEEKFLLGESEEQLSIEILRQTAALPLATSTSTLNSALTIRTSSSASTRRMRSAASASHKNRSKRNGAASELEFGRPSSMDFNDTGPSSRARKEAPLSPDPFAEAFGFEDLGEEEMNAINTQTFSQSTLEQAWYLPSVAVNSIEDDGEDVRQHLLHLFTTNSLSSDTHPQDRSQLNSRLSFNSSLSSGSMMDLNNILAGVSIDALTTPSKSRSLTRNSSRTKTAPSNQSKRSKKFNHSGALSKTEPNLRLHSPTQSLSRSPSPPKSPKGGSKSIESAEEVKERDFLEHLFNESGSQRSSSQPKRHARGVILDPVQHLLNIKKHFKHAPKYVVLEKNKKKHPNLAPIKRSKDGTVVGEDDALEGDKDEGKANRAGNEGDSIVDDSSQTGGFIFPALLAGGPRPVFLQESLSYDDQEEELSEHDNGEEPSKVPDIGVVGSVSELDRASLKQILLSR